LSLRAVLVTMLGLRYLACPDCGTVYAVPDDLGECERCGAAGLDPIDAGPGAAAYFSRGLRDRPGEGDG
jgi:hypothetical protein